MKEKEEQQREEELQREQELQREEEQERQEAERERLEEEQERQREEEQERQEAERERLEEEQELQREEEQERQEAERERLEEEQERQREEEAQRREEEAQQREEEAQQREEIQQEQEVPQPKVHLEKPSDQPQVVEQPKQELKEQVKPQIAPQKNSTNSSKNDTKLIILLIVAFVAVVIVGSVIVFSFSRKSVEENSNYIAFEDKKDDFTIDLPKDWAYEVVESGSGKDGYSIACINEELESTILIMVIPKDDESTADDLVDSISSMYSAFGFNSIYRDNVKINKVDGVKYEAIVGNSDIGEFYQTGFVTVGDEYSFSVIIQSSVDVMDEMKPTFDHVINSFELK